MNIRSTAAVAIALLALAAFSVQSCTDGRSETKTIPGIKDAVPVKVMALKQSASTATITASGRLTTDDETALSFKIGGIVSRVYVKEGDAVKRGQLLAVLDQTEINATVASARHALEKAERDHARTENLYRDSVATLEQLQNTKTALDVAREQYASAQFNQAHSEIRASSNGYVLSKLVNAGQVVGVGERVLVTNGATGEDWILKVGVSDKQWSRIRINEKASVRVDAFPGKEFEAVVNRKSETADPLSGVFTIELKLKPAGVKLATGMFGAATIYTAQTTQVWSVPYESVLDASGSEGFVFVTNDGKTAHKQLVTIVSFDGDRVNITKGLEDAAMLIVSGSAYLSDNTPINIIK
jgi:RND family efflux transporter MFP subunit